MKHILTLKDCILHGVQFQKDKLVNTSLPEGLDVEHKVHVAAKFSEKSPYDNDIGVGYVDYTFTIIIQHENITDHDGGLRPLVNLSITVRLIFEFERPAENAFLLRDSKEVREYIANDVVNIAWTYWRQECLRLLAASGLPQPEIPLVPNIDPPSQK